ncbi:PREDICTED: uncharacterized protein LOC104608165 [Nelumbo nucifera]|uniref:Uncharacterized protein LOC104608165 n=1 Tax=Nelumbo nucifera TaxID=4432 RepID=A0A1U8B8M6_NELNU|nr:PREDICTED: uncharacterized protein LOC104608165 [Nelumbo nucifera]
MEEFAVEDTAQLMEAASDFAYYPGVQNDASAKEFLDRFPLPVIINALQSKADVRNLEETLVACLERIFGTKYGASLIPQYMSFVKVGLLADSQIVRCLACKTVSFLLENADKSTSIASRLVIEYDIYQLLLDCLINGNEQVAAASMDAIKNLATYPRGMDIIFPANGDEVTQLRNLASHCSSLGRVRVLALIVKLFSISSSVASTIFNSNLLSLLEEEIHNTNDMLMTLSVLELLYEHFVIGFLVAYVAVEVFGEMLKCLLQQCSRIMYNIEKCQELVEIPHATGFLSRTTLLQILISMIGNISVQPILRSRAIMISGRILSKENTFMVIHESAIKAAVSAISGRLESLKDQDTDECETALEALGQIGLSLQGAELLLSNSSCVAKHVVDVAFDHNGRTKQLAALHSLGNIVGESRPDESIILNDEAEESLRHLINETASKSLKLTPSGLLLSVLQQDAEIRLAAYRLITGLVARSWCLIEICSKQEIIKIVIDPHIETKKKGMEARYNCCRAIHKYLSTANKLVSDPVLAGIASKLQEAVRRGPYLALERAEAQLVVVTAERF